jgi:hypothetical protein
MTAVVVGDIYTLMGRAGEPLPLPHSQPTGSTLHAPAEEAMRRPPRCPPALAPAPAPARRAAAEV